jgi:hypothetical protein
MDAELIALELVRAKVDRVRSLLQELEYPVSRATPIFEDHRGLRDAAHGVEAYGGSSSLNKKLLNIRTIGQKKKLPACMHFIICIHTCMYKKLKKGRAGN